MIQNCLSFLYPSIMCKNNIMVKMDETMFLLLFLSEKLVTGILVFSSFATIGQIRGWQFWEILWLEMAFYLTYFFWLEVIYSNALREHFSLLTAKRNFCHECFLRTRYYVCNKFNIWPQRKDKFIKFPSTFKGLRRSTQENLSLKSRVEK